MSKQKLLEINPHLFNLVTMFSSSAWCQLGKMQNPVSGKIENDLKGAEVTIDMLIMLRDKTKGNLTKKEEEMLFSTISNLQMNYADEAEKLERPDLKIEDNSTTDKIN
ncbi:MAG: DUF1844 domain-containing protein [Endomicrobium sp.]|jgi:hypothetical protein|nr:DUF1844 domain-containing protein [Endomicrobium sp.]